MKTLPRVLGLMVCKRLQVDVTRKQVNLIGISNTLRHPRSRSPAEDFTVYAALYGGKGEGTMQLVVFQVDTERRFYRYRRWLAFPELAGFVHLEIPVKNCNFPARGRYLMELSFDQRFLADRVIDVK